MPKVGESTRGAATVDTMGANSAINSSGAPSNAPKAETRKGGNGATSSLSPKYNPPETFSNEPVITSKTKDQEDNDLGSATDHIGNSIERYITHKIQSQDSNNLADLTEKDFSKTVDNENGIITISISKDLLEKLDPKILKKLEFRSFGANVGSWHYYGHTRINEKPDNGVEIRVQVQAFEKTISEANANSKSLRLSSE